MSKLKLEYLAISELIPYNKNPRDNKYAVEKVAASIKEFGFKNPIIIDKDNVIVAGHTRLLAAKELNLEEVPTIKAEDLTEDQIKAFRLADNKVSELSEWDMPLLSEELEDIDLDMGIFGFEFEENNIIKPEKKELKPYKKIHYLISLDINDNDKVIDLIDDLRAIGGVEIDNTLN